MPTSAATACWRSGRCCLFWPRQWRSQICSACGRNLSARVPAAGSARRHPRHVPVAAALGIDVWHLAVARAARRGDDRFSCRDRVEMRPARGIGPRAQRANWFVPTLAAVISVTLLVCGGFYTASEERLSYAYLLTGRPRIPPFPRLPAWLRRGRICRRSTSFYATPRPTSRSMTELFWFPARNLSTLPPAARRAFRCRSSIRLSIRIRPRDRVAGAVAQHPLADREDRRADQRGPYAAARSHDESADEEFKLAAKLHGYDVYRR